MPLDKLMRLFTYISVLLLPHLVHAQRPGNFRDLVGEFLSVINVLVPFVIGLTVVVFMWKIAQLWIFNSGNEESIQKGKQTALWGIIVLVLMFTIWGILALLQRTFFGFI